MYGDLQRNVEDRPVRAVDIAEYILRQFPGLVDAMKLQKLLYYTQAWSLAWGRGPMFPEAIEAWENGPVVPEVSREHPHRFSVDTVHGDALRVAADPVRRATITDVLNFYGERSGQALSDLTHTELPWRLTREVAGVVDGDHCNAEIDRGLIERYYEALANNQHLDEDAERRLAQNRLNQQGPLRSQPLVPEPA